MKNTTIIIASDHRGVVLKQILIQYLRTLNINTLNLGPNSSEEKADYPIIVTQTVKKILTKEATYGILICNTGIGMSIAANRFKGIRAALCHNPECASLAKKHNDANIIVFGGGYITPEAAKLSITAFLESHFEKGRHEDRIKMIENIEK